MNINGQIKGILTESECNEIYEMRRSSFLVFEESRYMVYVHECIKARLMWLENKRDGKSLSDIMSIQPPSLRQLLYSRGGRVVLAMLPPATQRAVPQICGTSNGEPLLSWPGLTAMPAPQPPRAVPQPPPTARQPLTAPPPTARQPLTAPQPTHILKQLLLTAPQRPTHPIPTQHVFTPVAHARLIVASAPVPMQYPAKTAPQFVPARFDSNDAPSDPRLRAIRSSAYWSHWNSSVNTVVTSPNRPSPATAQQLPKPPQQPTQPKPSIVKNTISKLLHERTTCLECLNDAKKAEAAIRPVYTESTQIQTALQRITPDLLAVQQSSNRCPQSRRLLLF